MVKYQSCNSLITTESIDNAPFLEIRAEALKIIISLLLFALSITQTRKICRIYRSKFNKARFDEPRDGAVHLDLK